MAEFELLPLCSGRRTSVSTESVRVHAPSAFDRMSSFAAHQHASERQSFERLFSATSFNGEVGLNSSGEGKATADIEVESFAFLAKLLSARSSSRRCSGG